jgi:exodeoxyribonuclease VII small subunit
MTLNNEDVMKELPQEKHTNDIQVDQLSFEAAFTQLEMIVAELETGEKPLENALALFDRGQELARRCAELLDRAELRVKQLSGAMESDFDQESMG